MLGNYSGNRSLRQTARRAILISALLGIAFTGPAFSQRSDNAPVQLTGEQKVKKAKKMLKEMHSILTYALQVHKEASEKQDVQKLNGVNEALSAIKGLLRLSEQSFVLLQESVAKNNARTAEHEFVKISIAYTKLKDLYGRVRSLTRPTAGGSVDGRPVIERILDPDLPTEDPLEGLKDIQVDIQRPPSASPFF